MMQVPTGWYDSVTTCTTVIVVPKWLVTSEARIDEGVSTSVYSATKHNLTTTNVRDWDMDGRKDRRLQMGWS